VSNEPAVLNETQRRRLNRLAIVPGVLMVGALLAQIPSATLANKAPLLLIALAPSDPFLILTVNSVPAWAFFVVGFTRLVLPDPFLYLIGSEFGPQGRAAIDAELGPRNRITKSIGWLDRWFPRFGPFFIAALPNYPVCLLSGLVRVKPWIFGALNASGTALRLFVIWRLGQVFSGPIGSVVEFLGRYQLAFMAIMAVLVVSQVWTSQDGTQDPAT